MPIAKGRSAEGYLTARQRLGEERKNGASALRRIPIYASYLAEVGEELATAYRLLDDMDWPRMPLVKRRLRDLEKYDRFLTVHTQRRGVRLIGGVVLLRGDGIAEERDDLHDELVVLA